MQRRDIFWNALGSLLYALASMVLAFVVLRLSGPEEGGIFGFGYSTLGQQLFIVGYFGIRPFHLTDMREEFGFSDYLYFRRLSCLLGLGLAGGYLALRYADGSYQPHKIMLLALLVIYKLVDAYADVYESELQRRHALYLAGQSLSFRTLMGSAALIFGLLLGLGLGTAVLAGLAAQLLGLWLFAVRPLAKFKLPEQSLRPARLKNLLWQTLLLFVSVFLDFYIFSAAKYAVDLRLGDEMNGYFNILFMPTSVIYLLANFMIRPMLTPLSEAWNQADMDEFRRGCRRLRRGVAVVALLCMLGVLTLGRVALRIFDWLLGGGQLGTLYPAFVLIIAGGCLYALANVQYYILVTMRRQRAVFTVYLLTALPALTLAPALTGRWSVSGAAFSYLLLMLCLFGGFSALFVRTPGGIR